MLATSFAYFLVVSRRLVCTITLISNNRYPDHPPLNVKDIVVL